MNETAQKNPLPSVKVPNSKKGILYVVSTPIGNLEDITLRALKTLKDVDLIAAENVRHTKGLCRHYDVRTKITSYNQHNHKHKGPNILKKIKSGLNIALVTSAGTPAISDPGSLLINMALNEGIQASPIPGPSAVITALSVAGMRMDQFLFMGFLPNKANKRRKELERIVNESRTIVFFEAPHRLMAMLKDVKELFGDRQVVVLKELTKMFEEVKRGSAGFILDEIQKQDIRGEFTVVMAGKDDADEQGGVNQKVLEEIEQMLKEKKLGAKGIATRISEQKGLNYRTIYKACLALQKELNE